MWIPRTDEEKLQWVKRTRSQATSFARLIGGSTFVAFTAAAYFGISLVPQYQMFAGAVTRPLSFAGAALIGLLIGAGLFRDVRRSELRKMESTTVCPKCGAMDRSDVGVACRCGGTFVKASEVRWVEESDEDSECQAAENLD